MNAHDEDEGLDQAYDWRLLRRFLAYARPHWGWALACVAVVFAGIGAELAGPFLLRAAIDGPVSRGDAAGLLIYAGGFFLAVFAAGVLRGLEQYVSEAAGQRMVYDLRTGLYGHLQRLDVAFFDRNPVGRLITRVTNDVENLSEMFSSGLVGLLSNSLMLLALLAAMAVMDLRLTLVVLASVPLAGVLAAWFRVHARQAHRDSRKAIAALAAYLNESLGGMKTLRIFNRQESCSERFRVKNDEFRDKAVRIAFVYSTFWPGIELVTTLAVVLLLWVAGRGILAGWLSFGSFVAFWYLVRKFFDPFHELAEKYNILQAAMASSERIFRLLDTAPRQRAPAAPSCPPRRGEIAFEDVCFSYDGRTPVLRDVSFRVRPGERVAIVGYTGAGKTSVLSLLLRLYDADSGRVLVDGADVRDHDPGELRRRFGMVFQDVFLFSGTVEENLRLGEDMPLDSLERAVRLVNAEPVIARLPKGLSSKVHERGMSLSVGERQLLSFARALAADPPILVLDEATSSVDSETEGRIQEALSRVLAGRTAVIVAHRLSTVRLADRILVLHRGELREQGTHEELLRLGGLYEKLYRLQWG
ncbi:MAG: ABC transporter ATP-binding protein [Elusimicrobiota bacterium]